MRVFFIVNFIADDHLGLAHLIGQAASASKASSCRLGREPENQTSQNGGVPRDSSQKIVLYEVSISHSWNPLNIILKFHVLQLQSFGHLPVQWNKGENRSAVVYPAQLFNSRFHFKKRFPCTHQFISNYGWINIKNIRSNSCSNHHSWSSAVSQQLCIWSSHGHLHCNIWRSVCSVSILSGALLQGLMRGIGVTNLLQTQLRNCLEAKGSNGSNAGIAVVPPQTLNRI